MLALAQLTTAYSNNNQQTTSPTAEPAGTSGNTRSSGTEFRYIKVRSGSIRSRSKETARVHVEDANYYEFRRASLGSSAEADPTCAQFKVCPGYAYHQWRTRVLVFFLYTFWRIQVMLLGDSGVGKTCFLLRFTDKTFLSGSFIATVGIDFRVIIKREVARNII